ncbi:unnamed protein product, partial [Notodromas monacha]
MLVFITDYFLVRRRHRLESAQAGMTVGEIVNSIISLDRGLEEIGDKASEIVSRRGSRAHNRLRGFSLNDDERLSMMSSRCCTPVLDDSVAYSVLDETATAAFDSVFDRKA